MHARQRAALAVVALVVVPWPAHARQDTGPGAGAAVRGVVRTADPPDLARAPAAR